jgi:dCTP deaminase
MGMLSKAEIYKVMSRPLVDRLVITPLLDVDNQIGETSVDVRLGNEFILTRKRTFSSLDLGQPVEIKSKITKYQERIRIELRREFILHPNQLVLGSTLEYIRLPADIGSYVIGRSSWGRVGLVIATASAVAPNFKGAITLELVNLGEVPLILYPGIRIAQLVLHWTKKGDAYTGRYQCPTGPQFSRIHEDPELPFWCPGQPTEP